MCAYGAPYRKYTRILTNLVNLCSLQRECHHVRHAVQLSGQTKTWDGEKWVNKNRIGHSLPVHIRSNCPKHGRRYLGEHVPKMLKRSVARILEELRQSSSKRPKNGQRNTNGFSKISQSRSPLSSSISFTAKTPLSSKTKRQRREKAKSKLQKAWDSAAKVFPGFGHLNQSAST